MSHIAVERNRRRQMNDHLKVLRSLTPAFYIKRGDQASIIGGAVEFIKELQTLLESLEAKKKRKQRQQQMQLQLHGGGGGGSGSLSPATPSPRSLLTSASASPAATSKLELGACCNSPAADVEAKISGSNVLLRTLSRRIPGHALTIIALLEALHLEVLHLNITTMQDTVLHSLVLKIGLECQLSVEDLAFQVHNTFCCHQDLMYSSSSMAI